MSMEGKKHTEEAKKRIGDALRRPIEDDANALRLIGQTTAWEFAERVGCSEQIARLRLKRLVKEGHAERFRLRGRTGYIYAIAVQPGLNLPLAGAPSGT